MKLTGGLMLSSRGLDEHTGTAFLIVTGAANDEGLGLKHLVMPEELGLGGRWRIGFTRVEYEP